MMPRDEARSAMPSLSGRILRLDAAHGLARSGLRGFVDLVFPPRCAVCSIDLEDRTTDTLICSECRESFGSLGQRCPRCAAPWTRHAAASNDCMYCKKRRYRFSATIAAGPYRDKLRDVVLRTKKTRNQKLTETMGRYLAELLDQAAWTREVSLIASVPMIWTRRLMRGGNTSETLAATIGRQLRIKSNPRILRLRRRLHKQGTLLPGQRFRNMRGAFRVKAGYDLEGACVLLVDDVMTTGATANAAARALRDAGAGEVRVAVIARGVGLDLV